MSKNVLPYTEPTNTSRISLFSLVLVLLVCPALFAGIRLPSLISDGLVLQQKTEVRVWGWADTEETITVSVAGQKHQAEVKDSTWEITLHPVDAGGPHDLTIYGGDTLTVADVYFGEVWLCSGQSNMGMRIKNLKEEDQETEIAQANDSLLRMITVKQTSLHEPALDFVTSGWKLSVSDTIEKFSAAAYFFGKKLRKELGVPVGLIVSAWPGTQAEAWIPDEALNSWEKSVYSTDELKKINSEKSARRIRFRTQLEAWEKAGKHSGPFNDPGIPDSCRKWIFPSDDLSSWKEKQVPGVVDTMVENIEIDAGVWFRRTVDIPGEWNGRDLTLSLGRVDDFDTTWFNGEKIGYTGKETENAWKTPRVYKIPGKLVKQGSNSLVVRVWDHFGGGGFYSTPDSIWIGPEEQSRQASIPLAGTWHVQIEQYRPRKPIERIDDPDFHSSLYNGMIAPLKPFAFTGVIWYQGEANAKRNPEHYETLLPTLISSWRSELDNGTFPFYVVQLVNYREIALQPMESSWALVREAQDKVSRSLKNVFTTTNIDIGEADDIHPKNKMDIGHRLALAALAQTYEKKLVYSGPVFRSIQKKRSTFRIRFDHVGSGLTTRGDEPVSGFAVAGPDGDFAWAAAKIVGKNIVEIEPPESIDNPTFIRYAWADNPSCNLFNKEGLPARPFRTDRLSFGEAGVHTARK